MLVDGDAASVVADGYPAVGLEPDLNAVALSRHRFIDGVIDDFIDEVMEPARIGRADVHPGVAPDSLDPLQDLNVGGRVAGGFGGHFVSM